MIKSNFEGTTVQGTFPCW